MSNPCDESNESTDRSLVIKRDEQGRVVQVLENLVGRSNLLVYAIDPALALHKLFNLPENLGKSGG